MDELLDLYKTQATKEEFDRMVLELFSIISENDLKWVDRQ